MELAAAVSGGECGVERFRAGFLSCPGELRRGGENDRATGSRLLHPSARRGQRHAPSRKKGGTLASPALAFFGACAARTWALAAQSVASVRRVENAEAAPQRARRRAAAGRDLRTCRTYFRSSDALTVRGARGSRLSSSRERRASRAASRASSAASFCRSVAFSARNSLVASTSTGMTSL